MNTFFFDIEEGRGYAMDVENTMCAVSWLVIQDGNVMLECRDLFGSPHPNMLGLPFQLVSGAQMDERIIKEECSKRYACGVVRYDLLLKSTFSSDAFSARCYLVHLDGPIRTKDPYVRLVSPPDAVARAHPFAAEAISRAVGGG